MLRPAHSDEQTGNLPENGRFSERLSVEYYDQQRALVQTGQTVRKQFFMQIYAMAHYLEDAPLTADESIYSSIMESPAIKQITIVFLRSLTASQIQKSLSSGLIANAGKENTSLQPYVERFMSAINADVQRNDEFILRWYPDGTLDSFHQGTRISSIRNIEFAKTMWAIWFGDGAVVDRAALVARL